MDASARAASQPWLARINAIRKAKVAHYVDTLQPPHWQDAGVRQVILELKSQEIAYQTALAVTARALQPTLMSLLS